MKECYENLANAIVLQAVKDYRASWKKRTGGIERKRIEDFFYSDFFGNITDVDPGYLVRKLKEEHQ